MSPFHFFEVHNPSHVSISYLGVHNPSIAQQRTTDNRVKSDSSENEGETAAKSGNLPDPEDQGYNYLAISCCPRNGDWKSGKGSVFLWAHRADLRKSWCPLMLQNHICRAGTRATAPQKCTTAMKKTYSITSLTCQNFSYLMAVSESGFSLIVLGELINFSLLQPMCVRQELPTAFKCYGFDIHQHFLSSLNTSESFHATVYLQYRFMPLAILETSHTPSL